MKSAMLRRPPLTIQQILAWADAHFRRTGRWPTNRCGAIVDAPGETWTGVHNALYVGDLGLTAGSSLARLLAKAGRKRNRAELPHLTEEQILGWADAHFARERRWPHGELGALVEAPEETWRGINEALKSARRGLPGGSSLARLLRRHQYEWLRTKYEPIRVRTARRDDTPASGSSFTVNRRLTGGAGVAKKEQE
jgi:hypothetical protein